MKYIDLIGKIEKKEDRIITKNNLFKDYKNIYKNSNIRSFENAISYLKSNNIISEVVEDEYYAVTKEIYEYQGNTELNKIYKIIDSEYPNIKFTMWDTNILNEFTLHYAINNYIIVEVEKIVIELIVNLLKEKFLNKYTIITQEIFIKNSQLFLNSEKLIIVKPIVLKAPLRKVDNKKYPTIEKIIVDLYTDKLYTQFQGKELRTIYANIFEKYDINFKRLFSYANSRTNISEFKRYIKELNVIEDYKLKEA